MARQKHGDFYQSLREDMRRWLKSKAGENSEWAEYLMWAPDLFHLMCKLAIDPEVPTEEKAKLAAAIVYFISPLDLIPEAIVGPAGFVDDIALAAYVLNSVMKKAGKKVVRKHWAGEEDVLELIEHILEVADQMVGSGLWNKIKALV